MRSIFASCLAIFLLVSCTKDDILLVPGNPEVVVTTQTTDISVYVALESGEVKEGGCCEGGACLTPVTDAEVKVYGLSESTPQSSSITDMEGLATFSDLPVSTYVIGVHSEFGRQDIEIRVTKPGKRVLHVIFQD